MTALVEATATAAPARTRSLPLVDATRAELRRILADASVPVEIVGLEEFPEIGDVAETGRTFAENALLKAHAVAQRSGLPARPQRTVRCIPPVREALAQRRQPQRPRLLQGQRIARRDEARREAGADDALRAHRQEGAHRRAIRPGIGIGDVHARQRRQPAHVEFRIRRHPPERPAVPGQAVAIGMAEAAEIRAAEGLQAPGGGLGHLPRRMDLVIQQHQHAEPARLPA